MFDAARPVLRVLLLIGVLVVLGGCPSPLTRTTDEQLRDQMLNSYRRQIGAIAEGPIIELQHGQSSVLDDLETDQLEELEQMSGWRTYEDMPLELGPDLEGSTDPQVVEITLQRAVELAVQNNLNLQVARLRPAIAQTQVTRAEAVFDAVFFTNANYGKLDTPQPTGAIPGLSGNVQSEQFELETGIRKQLVSGGTATVETIISRNEQVPSINSVPRDYDADVLLSLEQPLLRGFGSDVNRAEIVIRQNERRIDVENLRSDLIELSAAVEEQFWRLFFAKQQLRIQLRLLERTIEDRDRLKARRPFDVSPVEVTEANSFVQRTRSDVIRARQALRVESDNLKRLINAPELPVTGETLLLPVDTPSTEPIQFSLLDAVESALRNRPELQVALLDIRNASVRQRVADNARLPLLDLAATVTFNGLSTNDAWDAYDNIGEGDFIDYILGAQFEMPIGNRDAEALYTQRLLERRGFILLYRDRAQEVVVEVKIALRDILSSYELIDSNYAFRLAAADNLRALEEKEEAGEALTPEFINLKLQAQQRLAEAELEEVRAQTDYNNAIAELYRSIGTLLERNGIAFSDPEGG